MEPADGALILKVADGDGAALAALYDRHGRVAFGLAYRILGDAAAAEEAVQDAFLQVWRRASSFDSTRGSGFRAWLLTIVHNRSIDHLRRRAQQQSRETELLEDGPYRDPSDPAGEVLANLTGEEVRTAMAVLPPDQREAIELAYFEGLAHREISERTGTPLGTVKGRLRLGLKKLHDELAPGARGVIPQSGTGLPGVNL